VRVRIRFYFLITYTLSLLYLIGHSIKSNIMVLNPYINLSSKIHPFNFTGPTIDRTYLGLPNCWKTIWSWLTNSRPNIHTTEPHIPEIKLKFPDIPHLPSYRHNPPQSFWDSFPKNINSDTISTPLNVDTFKNYVDMCAPEWTPMQIKIAEDAISNLTNGTTSKFKTFKNQTFSHAPPPPS
jgi:hypothetical protein